MFIDRWMDKEDMVHIYNGILLSHKKEWMWVSCSEVDELRPCYTERSKLEKQIPYINVYICNLEKYYWWTYLQGRNRDGDIENRHVDTVGDGGEGKINWETSIYMCILSCVKQVTSGKLLYNTGSPAWYFVII